MPIILVELLLQFMVATHAVRSGRAQPWLWIVIMAPGIGCLAYIVMVIVPEFLGGPAGQRAAKDVADVVAPLREYKRLLALVELSPTSENKAALAAECLRVGRAQDAVALYESCLHGLYEFDPKFLLGLARAQFAIANYAAAVAALDTLRAHNPTYQSTDGHLLYARALEAGGRVADAVAQYEALITYYPGEEARCRLALLLQKTGAIDRALALFAEIVRNVERRGQVYRRSERPWYETATRMQAS